MEFMIDCCKYSAAFHSAPGSACMYCMLQQCRHVNAECVLFSHAVFFRGEIEEKMEMWNLNLSVLPLFLSLNVLSNQHKGFHRETKLILCADHTHRASVAM